MLRANTPSRNCGQRMSDERRERPWGHRQAAKWRARRATLCTTAPPVPSLRPSERELLLLLLLPVASFGVFLRGYILERSCNMIN